MRPTWDMYFLEVARVISTRGDCRRRQVGAVLVDADNRIIGTGYNGAEPGGPSCIAGDCPRSYSNVPSGVGDYDMCISIHAESNALLFARTSVKGATLYCTDEPCPGCAKLLRGAGVVRTVIA